jgi:GTP-binding protein HflX
VERAILVGMALPGNSSWDTDDTLNELALLADTAGAQVVDRMVQKREASIRLFLSVGARLRNWRSA